MTGLAEHPWEGPYDPYYIQTEFEVIPSEVILGKVITDLHLNKEWGKKFANGETLKTKETMQLLKSRLDLRPVRNTSLIDIRVFSGYAPEAAKLANAIARTYQEHREHRAAKNRPKIVDSAVPGLRPVRPNKPLYITRGILGGALLALLVGGGSAGIAAWSRRRSSATPASPQTGGS